MFSNKNRLILAGMAMILLLGSTGCLRSLSTPPAATPNFATPLPANDLQSLQTKAALTATAAAAQTSNPSTPTATRTAGSPSIGGGEVTPVASATPTTTMPSLNLPTSTPTLPVIIVPTSTAGRPATYTLQYGEHPYCIARRFNVNQYDLLNLNGITEAQAPHLPVGTVLRIPQTGAFAGNRALSPHPATYTVASSDETFYSIACKYGDVEPSAIAAANGLTLGSLLTAGKTLRIP